MYKCFVLKDLKLLSFCLTCEVAEDTEGEGEAGGVSRLQGRLRVT